MLRKYIILLLLFLVMNVHEIENKKNLKKTGWFSNIHKIKSTSEKFFKASAKMIIGLDLLITVVDLFADDSDDHEFKDRVEAKFTDISSQLNQLMIRMGALQQSVDQIPLEIEINAVGRRLAGAIQKVNNWYDLALSYSSNLTQRNRDDLRKVSSTFTGIQSGDLRDTLSKMYNYIVPTTTRYLQKSFLELLIDHQKAKGDMMCGGGGSPSQYMYNLYKTFITTEMMGQVAETFGYYLQHDLYNVSVDFELRIAHESRQQRLTSYFGEFKNYVEATSTQFRPCDPPDLTRDTTFFEMEKLYRTVIASDYGLISKDSCYGGCSDINYKNFNGNRVMPFICRRLNKCQKTGRWSFCALQNVEGARTDQEDLATWDEPRIYDWIRDDYGNYHGENQNTCRGDQIMTDRDYLYYARWCETCICTCEGTDRLSTKGRGVEIFSLRPVRSQIDRNMVVTGIKFRREYSIICIQIKEGKLLPGGEIEEDSEEWRDDCSIDFVSFRTARWGLSSEYKEGEDYVIIEEKYNYIDLEDVIVEDGSVVSGVSFALSEPCGGGHRHLKLKLESMQFNFSSGELISPKKTHSSPTCHTNEISINDAMSPLKQPKPRIQTIISKSNSFVRFGVSSFKKDAGQTTLPFLDAQTIQTNPSTPLTGVGLFYKASLGYGGFLAFRINTLNYGKYMEGLNTTTANPI